MSNVKYIKTKNNNIIVFSEFQQHSEFEHFEPVSAGFISFGIDENGNPTCLCYGESYSLRLKSVPEDAKIAQRQILGHNY